jgi:hypothetical protein
MLRDSKLVETILEVDVSEDRIVGNAIYVESNIRKWPMVGDDIFVDDSEITTNTNIWGSSFGGDSDVGSNRGSRRDKEISEKTVKFFLGYFED